jgi:hypothetical protein
VAGTEGTGDALDQELGVFVNENGHLKKFVKEPK